MIEFSKFQLFSMTMLRYSTLSGFKDTQQSEMVVHSAVQFMQTHWLCTVRVDLARMPAKSVVKCSVTNVHIFLSATKLLLDTYLISARM
jgi:hypothetical protein